MPSLPSTTQSDARAIDATLVALGFVRGDDGVLYAPADSVVTLTPIGNFLELKSLDRRQRRHRGAVQGRAENLP
jgi:hypothetical protein